jgi:hypothetical protein
MEEQKAKTVEMNASQENKKLSYEKLNEVCMRLEQQNQYLVRELQKANLTNMFKRLDYLFKVVEYSHSFGDAEFVGNCIEEIKEAMTINAEEGKEEK